MSEKKFFVEGSRVIHEGKMVTTKILTVRTPEGDLVEYDELCADWQTSADEWEGGPCL